MFYFSDDPLIKKNCAPVIVSFTIHLGFVKLEMYIYIQVAKQQCSLISTTGNYVHISFTDYCLLIMDLEFLKLPNYFLLINRWKLAGIFKNVKYANLPKFLLKKNKGSSLMLASDRTPTSSLTTKQILSDASVVKLSSQSKERRICF